MVTTNFRAAKGRTGTCRPIRSLQLSTFVHHASRNAMFVAEWNQVKSGISDKGNQQPCLYTDERKGEKKWEKNRAKNMPLPDKPFPHHRSPICGKLSSFTEEKGNSIGLCTSQKLLPPTKHPVAITQFPGELNESLLGGVASKGSFAQQRKRKVDGHHQKENCYTLRTKKWSGNFIKFASIYLKILVMYL